MMGLLSSVNVMGDPVKQSSQSGKCIQISFYSNTPAIMPGYRTGIGIYIYCIYIYAVYIYSVYILNLGQDDGFFDPFLDLGHCKKCLNQPEKNI